MKKYLKYLILISICVLLYAPAHAGMNAMILGGNSGEAGSVTYLAEETWDGATEDETWGYLGSNYNNDDTPGHDSTTQKIELDGVTESGTVRAQIDLGQEYTEIWVRFTIKQTSSEAAVTFLSLQNDASTTLGKIAWMASGGMRVYYSAGEYDTTSTDPAINTEYCFYMHWKIETAGGNDGEADLSIDTSSPYALPGSTEAAVTTGDALTAGDGIRYVNFVADTDTVIEIDEIRINNSEIAN